jgi:hypothetical protein
MISSIRRAVIVRAQSGPAATIFVPHDQLG